MVSCIICYKVYDEDNICCVGDCVCIIEICLMSCQKWWVIVEVFSYSFKVVVEEVNKVEVQEVKQ